MTKHLKLKSRKLKRMTAWCCSLSRHLHRLNLTWTNCPAVCQQYMKCIQHEGRRKERADKEFTVICDLSCHTLTYKGNPNAGGYTHIHPQTHIYVHTKLATSDTVCCNSTLEIERWEDMMTDEVCVCVSSEVELTATPPQGSLYRLPCNSKLFFLTPHFEEERPE